MVTLYRDEWLNQAKRVPVGQKRRVIHGAECTKAMDVFNNPESWSAYCHRCHAGGKVYKESIEKIDTSAPVFRKYLDYKSLVALDKAPSGVYSKVVKLLHDKGMSTVTIEALRPMYSKTDERLVFRFDGVDIGRDITGRSFAKWLIYHRDSPTGYVYLQGLKRMKLVVLCEDLFSAQKIRFYTGYSTLVLLGTNFKNEIAHFLLDKVAIIATDGDKAGWTGRNNIKRRCELFGIECHQVDVPDGLDPKDLPSHHLIEMFKFMESL